MKKGIPETTVRYTTKNITKLTVGAIAFEGVGMVINGFTRPQKDYDRSAMPIANIATHTLTYAPNPFEQNFVQNIKDNYMGTAIVTPLIVAYVVGHWLWQKTSKHPGTGWKESETGTAARAEVREVKKAKKQETRAKSDTIKIRKLERTMQKIQDRQQ